jgi:hypothetical protein
MIFKISSKILEDSPSQKCMRLCKGDWHLIAHVMRSMRYVGGFLQVFCFFYPGAKLRVTMTLNQCENQIEDNNYIPIV